MWVCRFLAWTALILGLVVAMFTVACAIMTVMYLRGDLPPNMTWELW